MKLHPLLQPPNARFWVWWNDGLVKITVAPDKPAIFGQSNPTDEGWSSQSDCYVHCGNYIQAIWSSDGCDCDGRLQRETEAFVFLHELRMEPMMRWIQGATMKEDVKVAEEHNGRPIMKPNWNMGKRRQRDYTAEAAGD
jgi:hypothetical protein